MAVKNKTGIPQYNLHKGTGQARVRLDGKDVYLGTYGTDESREAYAREIAEWMARKKEPAPKKCGSHVVVGQLTLLFLDYAKRHYCRNGTPTKHIYSVKSACGG